MGFRFPYKWKNTYPRGQPSPSANASAFLPFQMLPASSYFGAGIPVRYSFPVLQPPQKYVILAVPFAPLAGAGIPAGGEYLPQLLDPNAPPYPAYE